MEIFRSPRVTLIGRPQFVEPAHLPVTWQGESSDGERLAEFAGRLCYMSQHNPANRTTAEYLQNILKQGHGSVFEHAQYVLLLEGISRSCSHELVRHRAGFGYCLAGDTAVYSEHRWGGKRSGPTRRTIREIFEMTKTPHGRSRLKLLRLRSLDEEAGSFTTGRVKAVACSGVRPVFKVELDDGKTITCSKDHRFLTPTGWERLEDIVGLGMSGERLATWTRRDAEILVNGVSAVHDRDWLFRHYVELNLSQQSIAEIAGVSHHTVRSWVRRHGLQKPLGSWTLGAEPWNKGKRYTAGWHHSEETRALLSAAKQGQGNPHWRGGITPYAVAIRKSATARRKEVFARDSHTCRLCGRRGGKLTVHHVLPVWLRPELAAEIDNLATLCPSCHNSVNGRELDFVEKLGSRVDCSAVSTTPRLGRGNLMIPRRRRIVSVTYAGERETYDLEMEGPHHNFVANGIVTHNSQLSQRYVDESHAAFVMPPAIQGDAKLEQEWEAQVTQAQAAYVTAVEHLMARYEWVESKVHRRKMAREAARSVLPNATEVKIVVSANVRAWRTMLELRLGEGAELEIRRLAVEALTVLKTEAPRLFSDFEIYRADDGADAGRVGFHKV
jgi:thymidylate synthase (FAD)